MLSVPPSATDECCRLQLKGGDCNASVLCKWQASWPGFFTRIRLARPGYCAPVNNQPGNMPDKQSWQPTKVCCKWRNSCRNLRVISANLTHGVAVSTQAAPVKETARKNTVESIVTELIDINSEIFELKEELVAKGVPYTTLNALVDLARNEKEQDLFELKKSALSAAKSEYGVGAVTSELLENYLDKLVELEEDLGQVRKLARANELEPQAINFLTQVIRQNPGDGGTRVVGKIVEYARACGITVSGVQLVVDNTPAEPESVLPKIELPEPEKGGWKQWRQIATDVAIGLLMTIIALSLLT